MRQEMMGFGMQWHQLDHMQTICTSLQPPTPHHSIFTGRTLFLMPSQQCQSTEGKHGTATNQQADPVCYHQSESGWCGVHGVVVGWSLVDRLALEASHH